MIQSNKMISSVLKMKFINTRSAVDLAHNIHGKAPSGEGKAPVVILHGLFGTKKNWESLSKRISAECHRTVIAADMRNHGDSPHVSSHTYPELAADVSQLITKLAFSKVSIIGHSMGGRTAMVLALTEPIKVEKLIVVDISPISETSMTLDDFFPKLMKTMKSVSFNDVDNVVKARMKAKALLDGVATNIDFILMNVGQRPDKTFGWKCNLDALLGSFSAMASFPSEMAGKTYNGPTLFIGGQESNYIPPDDITEIRKLFPKAELKYIAGAGHNVHAEDPATFFKMASNFLSS